MKHVKRFFTGLLFIVILISVMVGIAHLMMIIAPKWVWVSLLLSVLLMALFYLAGCMFFPDEVEYEDEEETEGDLLNKAIEYLLLYHLQPNKVDHEEVKQFLISIGELEEEANFV